MTSTTPVTVSPSSRATCRLVDDDETGPLLIHRGTQGARFALVEHRKGGLHPHILNDTDATPGDGRGYLRLAWLVAPWQEFICHHIGDADDTKKAFIHRTYSSGHHSHGDHDA